MFLRISSAVLLLGAAAACSSKEESAAQGASDQAGEAIAAGDSVPQTVPCALAGAKEFKSDCTLERGTEGGKPMVIVRHPDGGFRRLLELDGGKRFAAADGADAVSIEPNQRELEVTVGDDHYLFPGPANAQASAAPR